ncbi:cryptochrome/photolyase family protein [Nakamurella aerolata]|uniref:Deoxyribodipyrimidine photo-lyase n=1 Tax=Nakamurella aerolata TaxID=1656892 RepID=A0A849A9P7_9ACTN|nr:deoxyribodipyrimidine photo-lyase [Nakamurella aerolata]NNG36336.1 deoxyribodipyrimidine photo-lyase [Nakamurella aerolata]
MTRSVMWFRRDLRTVDQPALAAAARTGQVVPLFVLDPALLGSAGTVRRDRLLASLRALDAACSGALVVRTGDPVAVVPALAAELGAAAVHVTGEPSPYGRRRDAKVREALHAKHIDWAVTGTPYAVGPGRVTKADGTPYRVFTPFSRAWRDHGWHSPARDVRVRWARGVDTEPLPGDGPTAASPGSPDERVGYPAGQAAARQRWQQFRDDALAGYDTGRDRPDLDGTSRMSVYLKFGEVHPRTLLADLVRPGRSMSAAEQRYVTELCWREFYADVLWHQPGSAWADLHPIAMDYAEPDYAEPDADFDRWQAGRTGFPMVDAGMRQLAAQGWMHNRLRMITASFLVKHLHVWWPHGARHFLNLLADGDIASNNHGWQWVAGTGTDAAPYFRIFNPVTQGKRFDPSGDYVRRWIPELAHLAGAAAHEPWKHPDGYSGGYPERMLDLAEQRQEALRRYQNR